MIPIKSSRVKDDVVERVRFAILSGELPPNEELKQEDLAQRLDVSRTPIREALRELESEGFVYSRGNRHTYVTEMDRQRIIEILDIFCCTELGFSELLAQRKARFTSLNVALENMIKEEGIRDRFWNAEKSFHLCLARLMDNPYLYLLQERQVDGVLGYVLKMSPDCQFRIEKLKEFVQGLENGNQKMRNAGLTQYYVNLKERLWIGRDNN